MLRRATGLPIEAKPIVAIVAARRITVRERPTDVAVLSSTQLVRWLQRRPTLLTDDQSNRLMTAALDPATRGNPPLPPADLLTGPAETTDRKASASTTAADAARRPSMDAEYVSMRPEWCPPISARSTSTKRRHLAAFRVEEPSALPVLADVSSLTIQIRGRPT